MFGYIATGRVNIRRYKEDSPPNNPSGKPANLPVPNGTFGRERSPARYRRSDGSGKQDVVWGGVDVNHYHGKKLGVVLKLKRKS